MSNEEGGIPTSQLRRLYHAWLERVKRADPGLAPVIDEIIKEEQDGKAPPDHQE